MARSVTPAADRRARAHRRSRWPRSNCRRSPRRDDGDARARGAAALQPRDRLRRGAGVRQRRREPRLVGRSGWRRWSSTGWSAARGRRRAAQPARRARLARRPARSRRSSARRRTGRRDDALAAVHARAAPARPRRDGRRARRPAGRRPRRGRRRRGRSPRPLLPAFGDGPVVVGPRPSDRRRRAAASPGPRCPGCGPRRAGRARRARSAPTTCCPSARWPATPDARDAACRGRLPPARRGRRRPGRDPRPPSSTAAARWRRPPARCSCTPTPCATGCGGSPRCAARRRPIPRGAFVLRSRWRSADCLRCGARHGSIERNPTTWSHDVLGKFRHTERTRRLDL